jgi:hypothetical protein
MYAHLLSLMDKQNAQYAVNLTKYAFLLRKLNQKAEAAALSAQARAASSAVSAGLPPASGPESKQTLTFTRNSLSTSGEQ